MTESTPVLPPTPVEQSPALNTPAEASTTTSNGSRIRRKQPQLLADVLVAEELIAGAPSRNGGRKLTEDRDPWTHNAWDQVEWDPELEQFAIEAVERQRKTPVPQELQDKFNSNPAAQWDTFYAHNKDNFFKERAWLQNEFPELEAVLQPDAGPKRVVEIGCGNGSTLFPLLAANQNPQFRLHGYDYSKEAVNVVKNHTSFNSNHLSCQVWDLSSSKGLPTDLEPNSVDIVSMIFVLSALHPNEWEQAVRNVYTMLKPGGVLLFRDYGRNDLAQLRFKAGRYMQDDELVGIFGGVRSSSSAASGSRTASTKKEEEQVDSVTTTTTTTSVLADENETSTEGETTTPVEEKVATTTSGTIPVTTATRVIARESKLDLLQLGVDRRMILNRKRQLKMMRVWLQGRWRKPIVEEKEEVASV
ncbi:hypothetical protein JCM5350_006756 [Sporobolomyces pararoseus]